MQPNRGHTLTIDEMTVMMLSLARVIIAAVASYHQVVGDEQEAVQ